MLCSIARLALLAALVGLPTQVGAQGLAVSAAPVDLTIPFDGVEFGTAVDASSSLVWTGSRQGKTKIIVQTLIADQAFDLSVQALNTSRVQTTGVVLLQAGMAPRDLITNIKKAVGRNAEPGTATLRYEASMPTAGPLPEATMDLHTVLYTITAQ